MEQRSENSPWPQFPLQRRWTEILADKALLVVIAIGFSAVIGGLVWSGKLAVNFLGVSGNTITLLILVGYVIHLRVRIQRLESKVAEQHRKDVAAFLAPADSPPKS